MKTIIIFGGSGFIGKHLVGELKEDYNIVVFSRNPTKAKEALPGKITIAHLDTGDPETVREFFDEADAVINLSGENIGGGKWTEAFKEKVKQSRKSIDDLIVSAFNTSKNRPSAILQGSAIGVYGTTAVHEKITETSPLVPEGFLPLVAAEHESNLKTLESQTRLVYLRTGIVLDKKEGALPRMALPFKLFAGGKTGTGKQYISWIHIKDQVRAIRFLLENPDISGPANLTAPNPVTQAEFAKHLGKTLKRPSFAVAPAFALKALLGKERAEELLLTGLAVTPMKLLDAGFQFSFANLEQALYNIYK